MDYTNQDIPQHVLTQIEGIRHKALEAYSADNIKAAEWLLDYIEYSSKNLIKKQIATGSITNRTAEMVGNYLKHIHAACKEEIESRFAKPLLSDEKVGELFYENMIRDYLEDIESGKPLTTKTGNYVLNLDVDRQIEAREKDMPLLKLLVGKW